MTSSKKGMIEDILNDFDFDTVLKVTKITHTLWYKDGERTPPSVRDLRNEAKRLLEDAWEYRKEWNGSTEDVEGVGCRGFYVDILQNSLVLHYQIGDRVAFFEEYNEDGSRKEE